MKKFLKIKKCSVKLISTQLFRCWFRISTRNQWRDYVFQIYSKRKVSSKMTLAQFRGPILIVFGKISFSRFHCRGLSEIFSPKKRQGYNEFFKSVKLSLCITFLKAKKSKWLQVLRHNFYDISNSNFWCQETSRPPTLT